MHCAQEELRVMLCHAQKWGQTVNLTRVYVANVDRLPRTVLAALMSAIGSIEVIDEATSKLSTSGLGDVFRELSHYRPNVLILGVNDPEEFEAFSNLATARVILLKTLGEETYCYQLRPEQKPLGPVSPSELISIIRNEDAVSS